MDSKDNNNGLYRITPSQQAFCSCCGALLTSVLVTPLDVVKVRLQAQNNPSLRGKPFLDSDGLTDHVYLYENGSGKTWNRTSGRFTGMMDAFMKIVQREGVKALWSGLPTSLLNCPCLPFLERTMINLLSVPRLMLCMPISPISCLKTLPLCGCFW